MTAKQTLPNNNDISLFQTCGPYRREKRAQKMVSHIVAQFAHDHGEDQNTHHHNCIVIHKSTKSG